MIMNKVSHIRWSIALFCVLKGHKAGSTLNSDTTAVRVTTAISRIAIHYAAHNLFKAMERYVGGLILFGLERFITHYH